MAPICSSFRLGTTLRDSRAPVISFLVAAALADPDVEILFFNIIVVSPIGESNNIVKYLECQRPHLSQTGLDDDTASCH